MNILGIGPLEILLIAVLALIVFGPERLPVMMGQVGRAIREFQKATSGLSDEFQRTLQAEIDQVQQAASLTPPPAAPPAPPVAPPAGAPAEPPVPAAPVERLVIAPADTHPVQPPADPSSATSGGIEGAPAHQSEPPSSNGHTNEHISSSSDLLPPY